MKIQPNPPRPPPEPPPRPLSTTTPTTSITSTFTANKTFLTVCDRHGEQKIHPQKYISSGVNMLRADFGLIGKVCMVAKGPDRKKIGSAGVPHGHEVCALRDRHGALVPADTMTNALSLKLRSIPKEVPCGRLCMFRRTPSVAVALRGDLPYPLSPPRLRLCRPL